MKMIDAHCHVFPDAIAEKASSNTGKFYGYPPYSDGRLSTLLSFGDELGIDHFVICSVATTPHQVNSVNRYLNETSRANRGRITALGALHPDSEDQEGDVEALIGLGLKGVKLHPDIQRIAVDDPRMLRIFELCEGKLPVLCHMGDSRFDFSNPRRVKRVLELFPRLTLIGAHLGGWSLWREAAELLHGYEGMRVDTSSSLAFLPPEEAVEIIRLYGTDRVMFGIDYPMWDPREEMKLYRALPLTAEERERIQHRNAAELYGIGL